MFEKRHYEVVAKVLSRGYDLAEGWRELKLMDAVVDDFIDVFKADNSRFDERRFEQAV